MSYVYRFINKDNDCIYVGYTSRDNLFGRMSEHFGSNPHLPKECYDDVARIDYKEYKHDGNARREEIKYIRMYDPTYNTTYKRKGCKKPMKIVLMEDWKTLTNIDITNPIPSYVNKLQWMQLIIVFLFGVSTILYMLTHMS